MPRVHTLRILLVEDDNTLSDTLAQALRQSGYTLDAVADGVAADAALCQDHFDLVILDLGLPHMDGMQVLKRLRTRKSNIPVLILTARDSLADRVNGLDVGADDYLAKPFDLLELEARIRALIRRRHGVSDTQIQHGPLSYDTVDKCATAHGRVLDLSAREVGLLEVLLLRAGRVVSKEQLTESLYGWDDDVGENAIEVGIHRLRRKLEPAGITIRTVRGLGYLLDKPDVE